MLLHKQWGLPLSSVITNPAQGITRADLGILDKAFKAVHKVGPIEGVAANAHHCTLPQTLLCRLVDGLQQRAACSGTPPVRFVLSAQHFRQVVTRFTIACSQQRADSEEDCLSHRLPTANIRLLKSLAVS